MFLALGHYIFKNFNSFTVQPKQVWEDIENVFILQFEKFGEDYSLIRKLKKAFVTRWTPVYNRIINFFSNK